jgi:dihydrolipoamide dehydrogenase
MEGTCSFENSSTVLVKSSHGSQRIEFRRAVIATGSRFRLPDNLLVDGKRVITPYDLVSLDKAPGKAVVLGGGIGGATSASLLSKMGAEVTLAYKGKSLLSMIDDDILRPAMQWLEKNKVRVMPESSYEVSPEGRSVKISSGGKDEEIAPDLIVIASPQVANTDKINLNNTKVKLDKKGFVTVNEDFRTSDPAIYAIGDVLGGARNASTAFREGISVANILAGKPGLPDYQAVPFTVYTEPNIASAGLTEKQARAKGLDFIVGKAPYSVEGGAVLAGDTTGMAKVLAEKDSHRILGVQIVGRNATDLIAEGMLAIEMGARLEDVALTLHPHPELCEVFYEACARAAGLSSNMAPQR